MCECIIITGKTMMYSLVDSLREACGPARPASEMLSATHQGLVYQGLLYCAMGFLGLLAPSVFPVILCMEPFNGSEIPFVRLAGVALLIIGYLYVQIARTNLEFFVSVSILDRIILPFIFIYLWSCGLRRNICILFAIMEPTLALMTLKSWSTEKMRVGSQE